MGESESVEVEIVQLPAAVGSRLADGRFPKGISGNPRGRPREQDQLLTMLRKELDGIHPLEKKLALKEGREARTNREVLVYRLVTRALTGDLKAIEAIMQRLYGKAPSRVEVSGEVEHVHDHDQRSLMMRQVFERIAALKPAMVEEQKQD